MRRFPARFSEPVSSVHALSWADFITATSALKLSVHTGEYMFHPIAEREVRESHDAGSDAGLDPQIGLTLRRDTCSEFDLADGTEFDRSFGSLMRTACPRCTC